MTPWTVTYQVPPSMEFSRQEYWSGLPFPSPVKQLSRNLLYSGTEVATFVGGPSDLGAKSSKEAL